ncbi:MAG TPA: HEAT repeat domain-containing protein [Gemmatimonadales bacterium]
MRQVALFLTVAAAPLAAQDLGTRVAAAPDGLVRMSYASKPGVCGRGQDVISRSGPRDGWDCDEGPVRVALDVRSGKVTAVRTYVGGHWGQAADRVTELGTVSAPAAAKYLVGLAERGLRKGDPILAATLADSAVVWPDLLRIGRNANLPRETRKQAVFWLSQDAGDAATRGLADLAEDQKQDRDVREHAVFALSQLDDDKGTEALIRLAKTNNDPAIRKRAIFWLGQSDDPRALALFEELLTRK